MKINENCLPCLINQVVKTAKMTGATDREDIYRKVFSFLSVTDFKEKTNPEVIGQCFRLLKEQLNDPDPYKELKQSFNRRFLSESEELGRSIQSFEECIKYAIVANIIDFNPIHADVNSDIKHFFSNIGQLELAINDSDKLMEDIRNAETLLYLGDNCGEICFDKLLIRNIKAINPNCEVWFAVRGEAVVNDNTYEDALFVKMDEVANIISNGDCSLGTVLQRTSPEFRRVFDKADVVIAKGQANYESLSEVNKCIYFLLMAKCNVIASDIGVREKSLICMRSKEKNNE